MADPVPTLGCMLSDNPPFNPYESQTIRNQPTAQAHYESREIKLRREESVPHVTSYTAHYPPKSLPLAAPIVTMDDSMSAPFRGASTYATHYPPKSIPHELPPSIPVLNGAPIVDPFPATTTYMREFTGKRMPYAAPASLDLEPVALPKPPPMMSTHERTYKKPVVPPRPARHHPPAPHPPPAPTNWVTSYTLSHKWPGLAAAQPIRPMETGNPSLPFEGKTTYNTFHDLKTPFSVPEEKPSGWRLPYPRPSLGVEYVGHNLCFKDRMFILIHKSQGCPATGKQIFTTVHDNQTECCILVLAGDDLTSSNNVLLGQFDLVGIPPAPMDTPKIEVTFKVRQHMGGEILEVEARDLDTGRHKEWIRNGGGIIIRDSAHKL